MAEKIEKDLEKALDESLEALSKAAKEEEAEDAKGEKKEDEDAKGEKPDFLKKKDKDGDKDDAKKEDEDAKGDKKEEDEDAKGDKKDEDKKEDEDEKSMREGHKSAAKDSLSKSETVANAIEVSKFLREVVKSLADSMGEMSYRIRSLEKSNAEFKDALVKSQAAQNDMLKSFGSDIAATAKAPLPRKGVDAKSVAALEKSFRNDEKGAAESTLTKSQIAEKLCDLEIGGKVPMGTVSKFETTGELNKSFEKLIHESK